MDYPLSSADIKGRLNGVGGFVGCTSYDLLPPLNNGDFCIVNTDNVLPVYDAPEGGHHWLTVCREQNVILVFDSFGRSLYTMEQDYTEPALCDFFKEAYADCKIITNTQAVQDRSTAVCGWYAILMGKLFSKYGLDEALRIFRRVFDEDEKLENDQLVLSLGALRGGGALWDTKVQKALHDGRQKKKSQSTPFHTQLANELHKPRRVHFKRRKVKSRSVDHIWSADLVDMQRFARSNKNYKFLLTVIDLYSRYAWAVPLKTKTGSAVRDAFDLILKTSNRVPQKLWVDEGKEFYNATMKQWVKDHNIIMYSTHNEGKAVVVERFNRTLKGRMWRHFTEKATTQYLDVLPQLMVKYNSSKHRSIGMSPTKASLDGKPKDADVHSKQSPAKFKVGDDVRLAVAKRHFEKGYTPNWTEEVFVVNDVLPTVPHTYRVQDLMGEVIQGQFYGAELQHARHTGLRFDKVLKYNKNSRLVKWKGYQDEKFHTWLTKKDVNDLKKY